MNDSRKIVILTFEPSITRLLLAILPLEGYTAVATHDPAEELWVVAECAQPCLLLTDNLKFNPAGREALSSLRENEALWKRVRVNRPGYRGRAPDGARLGHSG